MKMRGEIKVRSGTRGEAGKILLSRKVEVQNMGNRKGGLIIYF